MGHHKSFDERQANSDFLLVRGVLLTKEIQQCHFLVVDPVLEELPAGKNVRDHAHRIDHNNLDTCDRYSVLSMICASVTLILFLLYLCTNTPVKPSHVTRMPEPRIYTMGY